MSVVNGQRANQENFNEAFVSRKVDSNTKGVVSLENETEGYSGAFVSNPQGAINEVFDTIGQDGEQDANRKAYASENRISNGENRKEAIESLDSAFNETTGHKHTGAPGDAPQIEAGEIADVPLRGYFLQGVDFDAEGESEDVSASLTGKSASLGSSQLGVVADFPNNKVLIRKGPNGQQDDQYVDDEGNVVFGRLTFSASVWTLSFFVQNGATEEPYSFPPNSPVRWYYQELFNPLVNPPVYSELASIKSDNVSEDVRDATDTQSGVVVLSDTAPPSVGSANAIGSSARVARQDHTHEGVKSLNTFTEDVTIQGGDNVTVTNDSGTITIDSEDSLPLTRGRVFVGDGEDNVDVVFPESLSSPDYTVQITLENESANPQFLSYAIQLRAEAGFNVRFSETTIQEMTLHWVVVEDE